MEWPRNSNDETISARCRYEINCGSVVSQGCFHIYTHLLSFYRWHDTNLCIREISTNTQDYQMLVEF